MDGGKPTKGPRPHPPRNLTCHTSAHPVVAWRRTVQAGVQTASPCRSKAGRQEERCLQAVGCRRRMRSLTSVHQLVAVAAARKPRVPPATVPRMRSAPTWLVFCGRAGEKAGRGAPGLTARLHVPQNNGTPRGTQHTGSLRGAACSAGTARAWAARAHPQQRHRHHGQRDHRPLHNQHEGAPLVGRPRDEAVTQNAEQGDGDREPHRAAPVVWHRLLGTQTHGGGLHSVNRRSGVGPAAVQGTAGLEAAGGASARGRAAAGDEWMNAYGAQQNADWNFC